MTTPEDYDMSEFEAQLRYVNKGDIIFRLGRFDAAGWEFVGINNYGFSYYVATGEEDPTQYKRLARLLNIST